MSGLILLLDGVLDAKGREADPGRVHAHLGGGEGGVGRSATGRSEDLLTSLFLAESTCDRVRTSS